jgi:hypothetical protein
VDEISSQHTWADKAIWLLDPSLLIAPIETVAEVLGLEVYAIFPLLQSISLTAEG